jgi:hypothetical protein
LTAIILKEGICSERREDMRNFERQAAMDEDNE